AFAHFAGGRETPVVFVYLFHIVLACIFFSRAESLRVTVIACALYAGLMVLEGLGVLTATSIYTEVAWGGPAPGTSLAFLINSASALTILLVVWYLASQLSAMVRDRDNELAETNRHLVAAQRERARHLLHTTHELKSPFAAIQANTQLLLKGYCGDLPEEALSVVSRIATRCRMLTAEITEMLQLTNLRSRGAGPLVWKEVDLASALRWCINHFEPLAEEMGISVESEIRPASATVVEDHVKMLLGNLLSNAIRYSHRGGTVRVSCTAAPGSGAVVEVEDTGLGIPREKLPRIFDEYYRTDEAVRHNRESTGLGLAIVQHVARTHRVRVRVESSPGVGTRFELRFPPPPEAGGERALEE
ncbi:MAG: sensor histidine kinase, partial [Planctomycetota bacterium]